MIRFRLASRSSSTRSTKSEGWAKSTVLKSSFGKTLLIATLLCLWEGLPFTILDLPKIYGLQVFAVVIFAGTGAFIFRAFRGDVDIGWWERLAFLLFVYCVCISFIYSNFIRPQPFVAWVFAVYSVTPILMLFALRAMNCTIGDAMSALFWTGFIGSVALTVNQTFDLRLLEFYERGSAFGDDRVVFFKLESCFCVVISVVSLLHARSGRQLLVYLVAFAFTTYSIFFLTESRLAILAVSLALILIWLFVLSGKRKVLLFLISPWVALSMGIFVLNKYLTEFKGFSAYLSEDTSASWRRVTIEHFGRYFSETGGLGFGFMSASPNYTNIISYSSNYASADYGVVNYVVSLDDIGIFSALYQYGYVGISLMVLMTFVIAASLFRTKREGKAYLPIASVGILVATFMLSPISMNYFTLFYTAHVGGVLWFMAAGAGRLRTQKKGGSR